MNLCQAILKTLGDGRPKSGPALARELGVRPAAVRAAIAGLSEGLVQRYGGRYVVPKVFRPLDGARIRAALGAQASALAEITIADEIPSTNLALLARDAPGVCVCLAERQTAGRGRRGRSWQATAYGNLLLSIAWNTQQTARLGAVSLGSGVALVRALEDLGVAGAALKWPNDVLWQGRKLAGILVEMRGGPSAMRVVVGVGLNGTVGPREAAAIDQPWVDLRTILGEVDRDRVAAAVMARLLELIQDYEAQRLEELIQAWRTHHAWAGRLVEVHEREGVSWVGTAVDVDEDGALVVETAAGRRTVRAGEVSVRST